MADIDIPFNNDPVSTTVRTTSYTIPAGKFARVRVTQFGSDFKLDSTLTIPAHKQNGSVSVGSSGVTLFTNNTDYVLVGQIYKPGTGGSSQISVIPSSGATTSISPMSGIAMETAAGTAAATAGAILAPGERIYSKNWSGAAQTIVWNLSAMGPQHETTFWVSTGTLIEGDTFVVEEYNIIT